MNNVKKKLLIALTTATALTFTLIIVYQTDMISRLGKSLAAETKRADAAHRELAVKTSIIEELSYENELLKDSIEALNIEVANLQDAIVELNGIIKKLNKTIKNQADQVARLTQKIHALEKSGEANREEIGRLEQERSRLLVKMEEYDKYRQTVMEREAAAQREKEEEENKLKAAQQELLNQTLSATSQQSVESGSEQIVLNQPPSIDVPAPASAPTPPITHEIRHNNQKRLANIKANTTVQFKDIVLRKKETGNDLKKIGPHDWIYTFIEFDLDNPMKELILNETFMLVIHDLDNNVVVPMIESNPVFPESTSGNTGYRFIYNGSPVSIRYFNKQQKLGANYEIRLFHIKGDLLLQLDNGKKRIVQQGDVLKIR